MSGFSSLSSMGHERLLIAPVNRVQLLERRHRHACGAAERVARRPARRPARRASRARVPGSAEDGGPERPQQGRETFGGLLRVEQLRGHLDAQIARQPDELEDAARQVDKVDLVPDHPRAERPGGRVLREGRARGSRASCRASPQGEPGRRSGVRALWEPCRGRGGSLRRRSADGQECLENRSEGK